MSDARQQQEVAELLRQMPAWSDLAPGEAGVAQRQEIESAVRRIASYDVADVTAAVERFVVGTSADPSGLDVSAMSKLYVLDRYLFAVPPWTSLGARRFASFRGVPVEGDRIGELWPWSFDEGGVLRLTGVFAGYVGEAFQALREFEHFRDTYGLRDAR
jgi:hypothetical protein